MVPRKVALGTEKAMIDVKSPLASLSILPADDGEMAPLCTSGRLRLSRKFVKESSPCKLF
jgi:hypothetical protein